jgi:hypothetical protein
MRKLFPLLLSFCVLLALFPRPAQAELPPKAKAMLTILVYGTAGGALLGAASTAFGGTSRAVAQGASLGLYAGILFGTYVLVSHHQRNSGYYDDRSSPYRESTDVYGEDYESDGGGGSGDSGRSGGFFDRIQILQEKLHAQNGKGGGLPPIHVNLLRLEF